MAILKPPTVKQVLQTAGLKATRPRIAILQTLQHAKVPLPLPKIAEKIKKKADLVTLYRNLEAMQSTGVIRSIPNRNNESLYEQTPPSGTGHHHIICTTCHTTEEIPECDYKTIAIQAIKKSKKFKTITNHAFELYGLCKSCSMKNKKSR